MRKLSVLLLAALAGIGAAQAQPTTIVDFGAKFGSGWPRGIIPQYFPSYVDRTGDATLTNDFVSSYFFSETIPFTPPGLDFDTNALNAVFFGGMTLYTHSNQGQRPLTEGHLNQNHEFKDDFNLMTLPAPRTNAVSGLVEELLEAYGVFFWSKEYFQNGGSDFTVTFDANSYIAVDITRYWGGINAGRWLVRDGDQFYLSLKTFADSTTQVDVVNFVGQNPVHRQTHTLNPADTQWAPYNPVPNTNYPYEIDFDHTVATFAPRTFTNVTAVGFFVERYLSTPYPCAQALTLGEPIALKWGAFRAQAVVDSPAAPSRNLGMTDIGGVYLATNSVSYDLWRKMFRFGQRRTHVRDNLGMGKYTFERDGSMGLMRATGGEHNRLEPVTDITWYDAIAFCNSLSQFEGLEPAYYTDATFTNVFKEIFNRNVTAQWTNRPTIYWNTNAVGYRLPTPAEWAAMPVASQSTTFWEHVWFPAGVVADPTVESTRTALGWAADAPTNSILTFSEHPWWGSPRITFRPVRNNTGTPDFGPAVGVTAWNYTATTTLPSINPPDAHAIRSFINQHLPEVTLPNVGLATTNHKVDLGFDPAESLNPANAYPVKVGATEIPYRLWNYVQQWALDNGYTFNYSGAMGSMGAIAGDARTFSPDEPVTQMSWFDLISWCNALSEMLGLEPVYFRDGNFNTVWRETTQFRLETYHGERYPNYGQLPFEPVDTGFYITNYMNVNANGFRIPIPQEWNLANVTDANSRSNDYNWLRFNANGKTQPVGTKLPNPIGLYDMEGNVREWMWGDTRATISRVTVRKGSHFARGYQESHSFIDSHEVPSVGSTHVGFRTIRLHQELAATPALFDYAGTSDQTFSPRTLTVSNTGYASVSYTISTSASWMAISPASFSGLATGQATTHSLTINMPLPGGTYNGEIVITPDDPGIPALTSLVQVVVTERGTGEVVRARVDFGRAPLTSAGTWNNITDPVAGSLTGLIDTDGFENAIDVAITGPFAAMIEGGTTNANPALHYPGTASRDAATGGNPSSLIIGWGGDYISDTSNPQMTTGLATNFLNETAVRSPSAAAFNRNAPGGTFYANVRRGPDNTINYNAIDDNGGTNVICFQIRRDTSTGDITGHGAFVWMKTNFVNGFDVANTQVSRFRFVGRNTGTSGSNTIRWLVKQGSQYYISSNAYVVVGTTNTTIESAVSSIGGWQAYNPTNDLTYTPGSFAPLTLTNITAVGYYVYSYRADTPLNQILRLNVAEFQAHGQVSGTQPATDSTVRISGLNTNLHYALTFFASLLNPGANLQTEYRVTHADGVVTNHLNPSNNTASVAATAPLRPDSNGYLTIDLLAGPANTDPEGRYLLGVMEIVFTNLLPQTEGEADTDGDGIPDWWEELFFSGPTNANAGAMAANGVNTIKETFIAGLDPTHPNNQFEMDASMPPSALTWSPAISGRWYSVYWSTNLHHEFVPLVTNLPGPQAAYTTDVHTLNPSTFFRIEVKTQP